MIVRNISTRSITLRDTGGTTYTVGANSQTTLSDSLWSDNEFRRWLRLRFRDIVVSSVATGSITAGTIVNADIASGAAIGQSKLQGTRERLRMTGQGVFFQTFERSVASLATTTVDGVAYFILVGLLTGDVITNISTIITAGGTTMTLSKVGIYDKTGVRLASSADQTTAWQTAGLKTTALSVPYTVLTDDVYYLAIISKGTAVPTFLAGVNSTVAISQGVGSGAAALGVQTAQTDLPAPATISTSASNIKSFWMGLS